MHGYRRFCNKVYQATKYVLGKLDDSFTPLATASNTAGRSLAERWILHKFTTAAKDINAALTAREFSEATSIAYQYWYTHLCDVYIENSKSIIQSGTTQEQLSAKDTLYTALEGGLTMIHPFMPFISEELWQRLPRRPDDKTPSITIAKYPTYDSSLADPASEEAYELVLALSRGIRSLMAEYAIKDAGTITLQLTTPTALQTATDELPAIRSLSGKGVADISILGPDDKRPKGCVPFAVSAEATVFLLVKGRVDIEQEIEKARKKLERANEVIKRQKAILGEEGFQAKVKEELKEVERRKLRDAEAEGAELAASMEQFELLKLE